MIGAVAMKKTVKEAYQEAGWTAPSIAAELGVNFVSIYRWQSGECQPRLDTAMKFAELCGLYVDDIIWGGGPEPAEKAEDLPKEKA